MKIAVMVNSLGLGGTERAACRWAWGLQQRGHVVSVISLEDGPRHAELDSRELPVRISDPSANALAGLLRQISPNVIHAHAPGHPHEGDLLGEALALLPCKIPVVQTNVFGHLYNPKEDAWTDFRLFISWTSCVQAARRVFRPLDESFFRRSSVAVYPVDPEDPPPKSQIREFRRDLGVREDEILFGRLSRPDPRKWTDLPLKAFRRALRSRRDIKLLLREPPAHVADVLRRSLDAGQIVILPMTSNSDALRLTMASLDVVLHTSSIGESFGYGVAEPMNLGKPVITHSVPWQDQAQLELGRHGECGFVASTPKSMAGAMLRMAGDAAERTRMGETARRRIRELASPEESLDRVEMALGCALSGRPNPRVADDLRRARETAAHLDRDQFGHSFPEFCALWPFYMRVRFHQWRQVLRRHLVARGLQ